MGDENDLAPPFRCLEVRRQQLVDRLVVEVFVGLIDNQRAGIGDVHVEIQDQQDLRCPSCLETDFQVGAKEPLYTTTSPKNRNMVLASALISIEIS